MDQPTVLIISDDPDFSRMVAAHWQAQRSVPLFTLMTSDVSLSLDGGTFQFTIAGCMQADALSRVLESHDAAGKRVLVVVENAAAVRTLCAHWPAVTAIRQEDNWLDNVVVLGKEILCSCVAESRASQAESASAVLERQATLGRYMLEMRHSLNNALTAVLGNSELLLLQPGLGSPEIRSQAETIRNMTLRMHEILRRFSSLEKELNAVNRQPEKDSYRKAEVLAVQ